MNLRMVEDTIEEALVPQLGKRLLVDSVVLHHSQVTTVEKQCPT